MIITKIIDFFVGILVTNLILAVYVLLGGCYQICSICGSCSCAQNPIEAMTGFLYFFIITCIATGGIALIVWIPALLLLGLVVRGIFSTIFPSLKIKPQELTQNTDLSAYGQLSNNELAIIKYIVDCRNAGIIDDTTIRSNLKCVGWKEIDINSAFQKCAPKV